MPSVKNGDTIRFLKSFSYGDVQYEPESTTQVGVRMNAKSASLAIRAGVAEVVPVPSLVATLAPKVLEPSEASIIVPAVPVDEPEKAFALPAPVEVLDTGGPLTSEEGVKLERLEKVISDNLQGFKRTGLALLEIRDKRLYRSEFKTFEAYCQERWSMTRQYANRLVGAAEVARSLGPVLDDLETKVSKIDLGETHMRPLVSVAPEKREEVLRKAVETAPNGKVTAKHVSEAVREVCPEKAKPKKEPGADAGETEDNYDDDGTCLLKLTMRYSDRPRVVRMLEEFGFKRKGDSLHLPHKKKE